ncbi:hypothetical protein [Massilia sp. erpn]|uniref:hypothetical protein n=1 Tax=Massilia sp. erpn TaxID=2738142 RepID=UPI002103BB8F|nr:hypothetical protein [Massilia sp. erpn]UTY58983.1 hypothetical protein HPQ68_18435 [Massilia sp. erpn]
MLRKIGKLKLLHLLGAMAFSAVGVSGAIKGAIPWWPAIFFGFCASFMLLEQFGWKPYLNRLELSSSGIRRTFGPALRAKKVEEVAWLDVSRIEVETTDAGPAVDDMFFWIHGASGKGVVVPSEIAGKYGLVKELQARFPGLDNHALVEASGCCSNRYFLLWEKLAS